MSDTATDELTDLRTRVVLLERAMSRAVAPAAAPPIVIGPFDNVPAPGSPIRSDWPQEISQYVVDEHAVNDHNVTWYTRGNPTYFGAMLFQGQTLAVTTDAAGAGRVTFPIAYAVTPVVVANFYQNDYAYVANVYAVSTTEFVYVLVNDAGGVVANRPHTLQWGAFGARLT